MFGRKSALWLAAAAISVLSFANVHSAAADDELPCNGAIELCERTLDQVVLPGTHNSMSNAEYKWILPNQYYSIPKQLDYGIRAMLIDTHYGKPVGDRVFDWNKSADGNPHEAGAPTYLCHTYCTLGATGLASELAKVAAFLEENPREVIVFVVQNGINPLDYAQAVEESGLIEFVYTGPTAAFPTLGEMIAANQRVVMLSENNTGSVPWFHDGYAGPLQETPYDFRVNEAGLALNTQQAMDQLTTEETLNSTCRPYRGGQTGGLFLMNHWVNGRLSNLEAKDDPTPDPAVSAILNQKDVLLNRARACELRRGKLPTILAVDLFGIGGLLAAVSELNGLDEPQGALITVKKPKAVQVKAGKTAVFRVNLRNAGDLAATKFRVCAQAPKRLARKGSICVRVTLGAGKSTVAKLRIPTRAKAKGKAAVKFTVHAPNGKLGTKTTLTVKAKKKPKRR